MAKEEQLQAALELAEKVMNPRELKEIFAHLPGQVVPLLLI